MTLQQIIAGAVYQFASRLTTDKRELKVGINNNAGPMAERVDEFLKDCDIVKYGEPDKHWREHALEFQRTEPEEVTFNEAIKIYSKAFAREIIGKAIKEDSPFQLLKGCGAGLPPVISDNQVLQFGEITLTKQRPLFWTPFERLCVNGNNCTIHSRRDGQHTIKGKGHFVVFENDWWREVIGFRFNIVSRHIAMKEKTSLYLQIQVPINADMEQVEALMKAEERKYANS